jgi:hypothetical protein
VITEKIPSDWRELQREVARVLEECGFDVEIERSTPTVRGTTEIDVYAAEMNRGRKSIILCECKHWKARVPQNTVHGFRTTVADTGANVGYIVGSSGFQSGAFEAAALTNVRLLTWREFQDEFEPQWIDVHLAPMLQSRFYPFLRWTEPLPPAGGRPLTEHEAERFWQLWRSYLPMAALLMPFTPGLGMRYPTLPLPHAEYPHLPHDVLEARGYRELFDRLTVHADAAVVTLRAAAFVDQ